MDSIIVSVIEYVSQKWFWFSNPFWILTQYMFAASFLLKYF